MKKFAALILSIMMMLTLVGFAQTASPTTADADNATITVNNPAKGETYTLYKLFDATVAAVADGETSTNTIAYQGTVPESLSAYFEAIGSTGYVKLKDGADEDALFEALTTWAGSATATVSAVSDGSTLEFTGLPYGYYVMTTSHKDSTTGKAAITVDSTKPNATINDKNETKVVAESKEADKDSYSIGDTITYTAKFIATNYIGSSSSAKQVYKYVIEDTLPEFLFDVKITSITIGGTAWANAPSAFTNKQIVIPWVDDDSASLYANGAEIVITYTAKLTDVVNINASNKNTIKITPYENDSTPFQDSSEASDEITTYAAGLKKTDGKNALAGAKFAFYGLTVDKTSDGVYTVTNYDSTSTTIGTEMEVDQNGKLYIVGLGAAVELTGVETVAPDGYNKLTTEIALTPQVLQTEVYKESGTRYYDVKGNLVSEEVTGGSSKTVEKNLSELDEDALEVVNEAGAVLPSTGGIGTTIFYVAGSMMVLAAAILLITKRRVGIED